MVDVDEMKAADEFGVEFAVEMQPDLNAFLMKGLRFIENHPHVAKYATKDDAWRALAQILVASAVAIFEAKQPLARSQFEEICGDWFDEAQDAIKQWKNKT
jgi:hypothetical protein